jgi:hypothetical protein
MISALVYVEVVDVYLRRSDAVNKRNHKENLKKAQMQCIGLETMQPFISHNFGVSWVTEAWACGPGLGLKNSKPKPWAHSSPA